MMADVSFRPVSTADRMLLLRIYASSREQEMALVPWTGAEKAAFLEQQFDFQDRHYRTAFEGAEFSIIAIRGEDAGRLIVHRGEASIELMDITLLPPWRNQGLGTGIIRELMEEASGSEKSLRLWVEQFNPARRLYERLGFAHESDHGIHLEFVFSRRPAQPNTAS
ncbi:MAG TPA: GNAT family N-acetyltransferase [Verrucomicrobiales bacterium]|jgi:GNAT superfamily N-acetyltransferase|nr:GNAT family N-acetyltransferase [Verrucomicrobiales bacterium]